ncbi:MAG: M12 family metallopeptidase [Phycisphaerales bacterium]|nr:M12 family metallopeptidase [Phycisphaerales bacterium]
MKLIRFAPSISLIGLAFCAASLCAAPQQVSMHNDPHRTHAPADKAGVGQPPEDDAAMLLIPEELRPEIPCEVLRLETGPNRAGVQMNTWADGIVPYVFNANVSSQNQTRTLAAMAEIEAVTSVNFIPRTSESDYIVMNSSTVNNSFVGRITGPQNVNIFNWATRFIIVHELMHALGFEHEHQRADRNSYVDVNFDNICCSAEFNFFIASGITDFGAYDFDSVMHYGQYDFTNGSPCCGPEDRTITVLAPNEAMQTVIGQRDHLSTGDIEALQALYEGTPTPLPFFEDFESGTFDPARWTGIDSATVSLDGLNPPSGTHSVNLAGSSQGGQKIRTGVMNTQGAGSVIVSYAYQRTGGGNSPEASEDLVVEYRDANGSWIEFARHLGSDVDMTTFATNEVTLNGAALHDGFRVRFRAISGNIAQDDWYVDDISVATPIANNNCLFASQVFAGNTPITTTLATTTGPTELCGDLNNDAWYFFVTPCDGTLDISVCDATFNAQLAVYGVSCPGGSGTALACSDDTCGVGPAVSLAVSSGQLYRIRVGSSDGSTGLATLSVNCSIDTEPCPADCAPDNGDGTYGNGDVNIDDIVAVINSFGDPGGPCDVSPDNGDGTYGNGSINIDDLVAVINGFGACP